MSTCFYRIVTDLGSSLTRVAVCVPVFESVERYIVLGGAQVDAIFCGNSVVKNHSINRISRRSPSPTSRPNNQHVSKKMAATLANKVAKAETKRIEEILYATNVFAYFVKSAALDPRHFTIT